MDKMIQHRDPGDENPGDNSAEIHGHTWTVDRKRSTEVFKVFWCSICGNYKVVFAGGGVIVPNGYEPSVLLRRELDIMDQPPDIEKFNAARTGMKL